VQQDNDKEEKKCAHYHLQHFCFTWKTVFAVQVINLKEPQLKQSSSCWEMSTAIVIAVTAIIRTEE
jgi:hypothetical protein